MEDRRMFKRPKNRSEESHVRSGPSAIPSQSEPLIEQIVKDSIPPADSVIVPTSFESFATEAGAAASAASAIEPDTPTPSITTGPPSSSPGKTAEATLPSELQLALAVLALGQLNGNDRTQELNRLRHHYGGLKVEDTIADFIRLGFMDEGQVLTAAGTLFLSKHRGR